MYIIPLTTASFWREASPEGATQESLGREPWERMKLKKEALKVKQLYRQDEGTSESRLWQLTRLAVPPLQGFLQW